LAGARRSGDGKEDPNAPDKDLIEIWDELEPEVMEEDMIPRRGILPMGNFFTEATPLSFFTCLWKHLKEKNVTPEAS
jgi:hypothetical protein